jgi:hypothetical protein
MTLTHPFAYWQRNDSYANALTLSNTHVYNRSEAVNTTDLHVRSYLHTRVSVATTTTSPPPVDWFHALTFLQQGQWTPAPVTIMSTADDGDFGDLLAAPLVLTGHYPIASPGRDVAFWSSQKIESARVFHAVPDDNADFPSVQSGLTIRDPQGVFFPDNGYVTEVVIRQYLETLWASKVPPG